MTVSAHMTIIMCVVVYVYSVHTRKEKSFQTGNKPFFPICAHMYVHAWQMYMTDVQLTGVGAVVGARVGAGVGSAVGA
jgi:hypothetical protein